MRWKHFSEKTAQVCRAFRSVDGREKQSSKTSTKPQTKQKMKSTIKTAIACAVLAQLSLPKAEAARFKLEVRVPGYSSYAVVKPELRSQLGGRVRWNSSIGSFETDRVARGETIRVTLIPTTSGERCHNLGIMGIIANNDAINVAVGFMPYTASGWVVTYNPAHDNVRLAALTTAGVFDMRMPIGRRP